MHNAITDIPGIRVGHAQKHQALTGCTVILCETRAVGGVDQRGGAPGTRETALLHPLHLVEKVHAILLAGGSAFGLDAATGVMQYLEARGMGYETIGILALEDGPQEHPYTADELNLAITLANQAAIALENAQLYEELE